MAGKGAVGAVEDSRPDPRHRRWHYAYTILALGVVLNFAAVGLGRYALGALLPAMMAALALGPAQAGLLAACSLFTYMLFSPAGGAMASRCGPRRVILAGALAVAAGLALTGASWSWASALAAQALVGAGAGAANVSTYALAARWFDARRRGLSSGAIMVGSSLGLVATGLVVPFLAAVYGPVGWRVTWWSLGAAALAAAALAAVLAVDDPAARRLRPLGTAASGAAGGRAPTGASGLAAAAPAGGHRRTVASVWRLPAVWWLGVIYALWGLSYAGVLTFLVSFLLVERGFDAVAAGRAWALVGLLSAPSGVLGGVLSDTVGRPVALAGLLAVQAVMLTAMVAAPAAAILVAALAVYSVVLWSPPAVILAAGSELVEADRAGAAIGAVTLIFSVGQMLGPGLTGF
ncbi:MAG: MFS transporter, partial [Clostridia bacterium]|nr:MFS transporter [Clostridia bacterium]